MMTLTVIMTENVDIKKYCVTPLGNQVWKLLALNCVLKVNILILIVSFRTYGLLTTVSKVRALTKLYFQASFSALSRSRGKGVQPPLSFVIDILKHKRKLKTFSESSSPLHG